MVTSTSYRACLPIFVWVVSAAALMPPVCWPSPQQQGPGPSPPVVCQLCPTIVVECREEAPVFKASVRGAPPGKELTYAWTVSNAVIVSGQGTPSVTVEQQPDVRMVSATVEVGGLDGSCQSRASCSVAWGPPPAARLFDRYGALATGRQKERLDRFADELSGEPSLTGCIISYEGGRGEWAKRYLIAKHCLHPERIISLSGDPEGEAAVELYVVPAGAEHPKPARRKGKK